MHYSDLEFAASLKEKPGNIRFFKAVLREKGLIGARQQFSEVHREYFQEVRKLKDKERCTWDTAIHTVLTRKAQEKGLDAPSDSRLNESKDVVTLIQQILLTLQRIEQKL